MAQFLDTTITGSLAISGSNPYLKLGETSIQPQTTFIDGAYLWFDSDVRRARVLFTSGSGGCAWQTGEPLLTARMYVRSFGAAGYSGAAEGCVSPAACTCFEEYRAITWTTGPAVPTTAVQGRGTGCSLDAGLLVGGSSVSTTLEYNGASWSAGGSISEGGRLRPGLGGTQNTAFVVGGFDGANLCSLETYNGSTWSGGTDAPLSLYAWNAAGNSSAGIITGGHTPAACTLEYSAPTWAACGALNTARVEPATVGAQNVAMAAGGGNGNANSEFYNGTTWATGPAMSTGRGFTGNGVGSSINAIVTAGFSNTPTPGTYHANTEIFRNTTPFTVGGIWSSGGALNTARNLLAGVGSSQSGLVAGGLPAPGNSCTEEYNAHSWSTAANTLFATYGAASFGVQNASMIVGGGSLTSCAASYNGVSWTDRTSPPNPRCYSGGAGGLTSGLVFAGFITPAAVSSTEEWNGASWSAGGTITTARRSGASTGAQNSALFAGGRCAESPAVDVTCTEEYDGYAWSAGGALPIAKVVGAFGGGQNSTLYAAGSPSPAYEYNGTTWAGTSNMSTPTINPGSMGTTAKRSIGVTGGNTPAITCTEIYHCAFNTNVVCNLCTV